MLLLAKHDSDNFSIANISASDFDEIFLSAGPSEPIDQSEHSITRLITILTNHIAGPSEPIVEVVKPIRRGLNISWRTDVTSRQDKYIVVYTRY